MWITQFEKFKLKFGFTHLHCKLFYCYVLNTAFILEKLAKLFCLYFLRNFPIWSIYRSPNHSNSLWGQKTGIIITACRSISSMPRTERTKPVKSSSISLSTWFTSSNQSLSLDRKQKMKNTVLSLIKKERCTVCCWWKRTTTRRRRRREV